MVHAENYETAFTFVKVIQTDLLAFLLDTVYDKRPHISGYLRNGVAVGEK